MGGYPHPATTRHAGAGLAQPFPRPRFPAPLACGAGGVRRALAGDAGGRRLRLCRDPFRLRRRHADHAAPAADGAVRRPRSAPWRNGWTAGRRCCSRCCRRSPPPPTIAALALGGCGRGLAPRRRLLHERHRLGNGQSGAPGDDRPGRRAFAHECRDVHRCRHQQRQPRAGPDAGWRHARLDRPGRRLPAQCADLSAGGGRGAAADAHPAGGGRRRVARSSPPSPKASPLCGGNPAWWAPC